VALKSTVFKVRLNVADLDRNLYEDFSLAVARHPSETDARMMLRIAIYALHADAALEFGRGISTDDEPDLWRRDLTGSVEEWIELGTPDPDRLRKACGRSEAVRLYAYGERAMKVWWEKNAGGLERFANLSVFSIDDAAMSALGSLAAPGLALQCTISGGELWLTTGEESLALRPLCLRDAESD
jgi:uncharacterized protein YaeQ